MYFTMVPMADINKRQAEILSEIASIDKMRIGTISPNVKAYSTKTGGVVKSTYYVLSYKDSNQKSISESVKKGRLEEYQRLVNNAELFRKLVQEYEELADRKAKLSLAGVADEYAKKNKKSS